MIMNLFITIERINQSHIRYEVEDVNILVKLFVCETHLKEYEHVICDLLV